MRKSGFGMEGAAAVAQHARNGIEDKILSTSDLLGAAESQPDELVDWLGEHWHDVIGMSRKVFIDSLDARIRMTPAQFTDLKVRSANIKGMEPWSALKLADSLSVAGARALIEHLRG